MTKNKNSIWFLIGYGTALILLLYFGVSRLLVSAMGNAFPNVKFMTVLALLIIAAWSIGLGVRRCLTSFNENLRNRFKNSLLAITVMGWIIVLILFRLLDQLHFTYSLYAKADEPRLQ